MNVRSTVCFCSWLVLACALCILPGCGSKEDAEQSPTMTRLSWLGSKYGSYISQKGGKPPKTIKDLKEFVAQTTTQEQLARLGVADVETLFISTRDGKPFGLAHRSRMPPPGVGAPPIVLYEVTGERGWRAVAYLGGGTNTVDERELPQLLPPPPARAR